MKWQKESNGHILTINMDTESLIEQLNRRIQDFESELEEIGDGSADESDCIYERSRVYGADDDYVPIEECIEDLEKMKECILKMETDNLGETIWPLIALKKNGTFKRNSKPTIREEVFGSYWEDSYGWNTEILRIEASTDTEANVVLKDIVIHY